MWLYVSMPHATIAIEAADQRVVTAPPIGAWMVGKPLSTVLNYVARRGGHWSLLVQESCTERRHHDRNDNQDPGCGNTTDHAVGR